ncbi:TPA: competence protein CoiA [Legionella pneumophila]|nr:hypothetical protein [Legionella pneumophila]
MRFALVNDEIKEAQPGLSGTCKCCGHPTTAKCGQVKIWHWAHSGKRICDTWWENESEWHRAWKNYFPTDWQEFIHYDHNGERHIADIKTSQGYILEFQHSYLNPEERKKRTEFYGKIAWVVDGTRRRRDKEKFFEMINKSSSLCASPIVRIVCSSDSILLSEWYLTQAPVFFDFGEELLYCLLPNFIGSWRYFVEFPRSLFISLNQGAFQAEQCFEDCLNKLYIFAAEHRKNALFKIKHNLDTWYWRKNYKPTQEEINMQNQASNHLKKLYERFQIVMKPYFGAG